MRFKLHNVGVMQYRIQHLKNSKKNEHPTGSHTEVNKHHGNGR